MDFKRTIGGGLIAAAALAALTSGCSDNDRAQQPPTVVETPAPPPTNTTVVAPAPSTQTAVNPATAGPQTNNTNAGPGGAAGSALGDKITREIHTNAQMTGSRITAVSNADGTVRLTGRAQDRQQRALAVKTARDEPGTTHVVDKIQIVPTGGVKEAAAPPKVVVKKYFYVRQTPAPSKSTSSSTGNDIDQSGGMNGGVSNPKHPLDSEGGASSNMGLENDSNNGGLGGNNPQGQ